MTTKTISWSCAVSCTACTDPLLLLSTALFYCQPVILATCVRVSIVSIASTFVAHIEYGSHINVMLMMYDIILRVLTQLGGDRCTWIPPQCQHGELWKQTLSLGLGISNGRGIWEVEKMRLESTYSRKIWICMREVGSWNNEVSLLYRTYVSTWSRTRVPPCLSEQVTYLYISKNTTQQKNTRSTWTSHVILLLLRGLRSKFTACMCIQHKTPFHQHRTRRAPHVFHSHSLCQYHGTSNCCQAAGSGSAIQCLQYLLYPGTGEAPRGGLCSR